MESKRISTTLIKILDIVDRSVKDNVVSDKCMKILEIKNKTDFKEILSVVSSIVKEFENGDDSNFIKLKNILNDVD
tara:strand:- start:2216 stop:2443 length:228 start_codon:yes stop_codon:yes gene_type:complete